MNNTDSDTKPEFCTPKPGMASKEIPITPRLNRYYSPVPFNGDPYYIGARGVPTRPLWWDR